MKKLIQRIKYWLGIVPKWDKCRLASCWDGSNAQRRMMNILSPKFSDSKFREYVKWMKDRGCDTAHVIFQNGGDGEGAGYSVLDDGGKLANKRIKELFLEGFAIVGWLTTDDSGAYNRALFASPFSYVKALNDCGILKYCSIVVLGLEMDECGTVAQWTGVYKAVKAVIPKMKLGVHHTNGKHTMAALGDIVLDQISPNLANKRSVQAAIGKILAMGKAAIGFEYSRHPDRELAQAALDAGAFGCGNW